MKCLDFCYSPAVYATHVLYFIYEGNIRRGVYTVTSSLNNKYQIISPISRLIHVHINKRVTLSTLSFCSWLTVLGSRSNQTVQETRGRD